MVGASAGFFTARPDLALHSHITGVAPHGQGRGIGFALKVHQRAWALARGVPAIVWTFDPLVARNAWFNLAKLGATPTAYLEDFYGPMTDAINAGMASDRAVTWKWTQAVAPPTAGPGRPKRPGRPTGLTAGPGLEPVAQDTAPEVTVEGRPKESSPRPRRAWRAAVRQPSPGWRRACRPPGSCADRPLHARPAAGGDQMSSKGRARGRAACVAVPASSGRGDRDVIMSGRHRRRRGLGEGGRGRAPLPPPVATRREYAPFLVTEWPRGDSTPRRRRAMAFVKATHGQGGLSWP